MTKRFLAILLGVVFLFPAVGQAINIGDQAPDFQLTTYDGKPFRLSDHKGRVVVLEWFNPGCPFVRRHYDSGNMQGVQGRSVTKGAVWATINSTSKDHKDFLTNEAAAKYISDKAIKSSVVLHDETGEVGKLYGAKTTPHMFIVDENGKLVYQGAFDDNPGLEGDPAAAKNYVEDAVGELTSGRPVGTAETKPYGCSVKYAS